MSNTLPPATCGYYPLEMGQLELRHAMIVKDTRGFRLSMEKRMQNINNFIVINVYMLIF